MNKQRIKQFFINVARDCIAQQRPIPTFPEAGNLPKPNNTSFLVRGNLRLYGQSADTYLDVLSSIFSEVKDAQEGWNRAALDDLMADHLLPILEADDKHRAQITREQADAFVQQLSTPAQTWTIDLPVSGIAPDCVGVSFGVIAFGAGIIDLPDSLVNLLPQQSTEAGTFARLEAKGIDANAAVEGATELLQEHLTILNALCSTASGSLTHLTAGHQKPDESRVYRAWREVGIEDTAQRGISRKLTWIPLSRSRYEHNMAAYGGARISDWLRNRTEFGDRLLAAYILAGTASTDTLPARSFLLFAVALESAVMGKTNAPEIGFRLSTHIANLLGAGLSGKRLIKKQVKDLYDIRSKIAHFGMTDISETQVELMRQLCLLSLLAMTISPAFAAMTTSQQLDEWFADRLLDSPAHLG